MKRLLIVIMFLPVIILSCKKSNPADGPMGDIEKMSFESTGSTLAQLYSYSINGIIYTFPDAVNDKVGSVAVKVQTVNNATLKLYFRLNKKDDLNIKVFPQSRPSILAKITNNGIDAIVVDSVEIKGVFINNYCIVQFSN